MYYLPAMKTGRPTTATRSDFGARLAALRQAAGLSQQQLADRLGIVQPAYAAWERKNVALRPDQLAQLAQILGVEVGELLAAPPTRRRQSGPTGQARQVFERVSQLPRHQQQKILEVVSLFLNQFTAENQPPHKQKAR